MENHEVTELLVRWGGGDKAVLDRFLPLVYAELHHLAASYLRRERVDHTLQPAALINEAYLRLVDSSNVSWENRAHFFGIAARVMRRFRWRRIFTEVRSEKKWIWSPWTQRSRACRRWILSKASSLSFAILVV